MHDLTGQTIGPYRLVEKLGTGGMAEVYKAYQPRLDRYVAIKFIRPEFAADEGFRSRFEREAKAIARLSHPNIVHIYDFGEEGNLYYLVMEYIDGGTLKERLAVLNSAGETMEWGEVCRIARQVGEALDYAHQQGIVHRDVKPANVMLTADGRAVLNDFGIARMVGATSGLTQTGTTVGTPAYMSPEQIRGEQIGPSSDLYSLGVVLYEMLTGRVPFSADTPLAIMYKQLNDPIPLPRTLNPALPQATEAVVLRALAKEPADRYPSGQALVRALEQSLVAHTRPLKGVAAARPRQRPRLRPAWLAILAVLVVLLAFAACVVGVVQLRSALFPLGGQGGKVGIASPTSVTFSPTITPLPTIPPTPMAATPVTPVPTAAPETGALISVVRSFAAPGYSAQGITWDGTSLWISDSSGTLFQMDTEGRLLGAFADLEVTPTGLTWDGASFWLFATDDNRIYQFQVEGQQIRILGSFEAPMRVFGNYITQDLTWDGTSLWYANQFNVYHLDTTGTVLGSFAFPKNVVGLEWDGENLWLADNDEIAIQPATIYVVDASGNVRASFPCPLYRVQALAAGEGTLWALGQDWAAGDIMVYELDVSAARRALSPASAAGWQARVAAVTSLSTVPAYTSVPSAPPTTSRCCRGHDVRGRQAGAVPSHGWRHPEPAGHPSRRRPRA